MRSHATLMDLYAGAPAARVAWADLAKAISILLLVLWTTVGDRVYLNEMLILVRMPLFFFVSGLFAGRVIVRPDLGSFLRDKIGNLVYLYALWIALLYLATDAVVQLAQGRPLDAARELQLFWNPPFTIWFLYALAIAFLIARVLRNVPVWIVLAGAVALYLVSVASGEWRHLPFLERLVRLFPFFWLGLTAAPLTARLVERFHRWWPLAAALYLGLAWAVFNSPLSAVGPLTFAITLTGIAALLMLARRLADFAWSAPLAVVGGATLAIYVTHKIVLFYMDHVLARTGVDFPGLDALQVAPTVAICVIFGRWAQGRPWTAWLFAAPWLARRAALRPAAA